jgi:hypothetical protein
MPLVKYIGNAVASSGVTAIDLAPGDDGEPRSLLLDGPAVQVTGEEFAKLAGQFELQVVDGAPSVAPTPSPSPSSPAASTASTPSGAAATPSPDQPGS